MLKILKNLKYSFWSVVLIIVLLFAQAIADLKLPDYTSKIVNVGIQQGGVESVSPDAIRKSQLDKLLMFTDADDEIKSRYTLVNKDNFSEKEYEKYLKKYPEIENQDVYVLNKISTEERDQLDDKMARPFLQVSIIDNEETANTIKDEILKQIPAEQKMILQNLSLAEILHAMPEEQLKLFVEEINKQMGEIQETVLNQAAITQTKQEYIAIGIKEDKLQSDYILISGLQMLAVASISMLTGVAIMLLSSVVAAKLGQNLREKVFQKVLKFSTKEFREFSTASLITRSTNDIQQIQQLITMLFRVVIYAPIIGVGGVLRVIANSNTSMAWIIALAIGCMLGIVIVLFIIAMPKFQKLQKLIDKLNLVAREILTGLPVIRAFNKEKREESRFDQANTNLMKTGLFVERAMSFMFPLMVFIMNSISLLIVWQGGHNIDQGVMQVGDMMAFIQYTMQIIFAFLMISMMSIMLPRAAVSAKRINEVLDTDLSIKNPKEPKKFGKDKKGLLEFKNVSFKYPDADTEIITDIDFTAKPGETTAIIGSTGSGKSTVVNLIPRFYDVTGGEILLDGINVKEVTQSDLRSKIGFIPQKGVLFSGTIESNIKYGDAKISDKQMKKASDIAQATEFIEKKEDKYKSEIAQGGTNVSGGQKQRLSIARAIAIDPEVIVFDDSFSALDLKTDAKLRQELSKQTKDKTVVIVAQRISTIMEADQIIVLEEGKIVGKGTHKELMKNCDTYEQIALSQLSKEELE